MCLVSNERSYRKGTSIIGRHTVCFGILRGNEAYITDKAHGSFLIIWDALYIATIIPYKENSKSMQLGELY